jgi:hypothetical protein
MNVYKSIKFVFVVFEKKCWCSILILNEKFSIVSITTSIVFLRVRTKILETFLDLWFLFFAQATKRQSLDDVSMRNRNAWRNSIFFFRAMIFFFSFVVLRYSCHVCSVRIANQTRRLRRVVDTTSTHFWFQCDFDFDTNFVHDTVASMIF